MSTGSENDGRVRASDADRERVLSSLRQHAADGRLELRELSDRIEAALRARTLGELRDLTDDLPALPVAPPSARRRWHPQRRILEMLGADVVFLVIWLASGRGSFWPIWAFIATGVVFLGPSRRDRGGGPRAHPRHYDSELPGGIGGGKA